MHDARLPEDYVEKANAVTSKNSVRCYVLLLGLLYMTQNWIRLMCQVLMEIIVFGFNILVIWIICC